MALFLDSEPWPPGLCCCPTLKLYASSSLDCTIRIWTAENRLLRWAGAPKDGGGNEGGSEGGGREGWRAELEPWGNQLGSPASAPSRARGLTGETGTCPSCSLYFLLFGAGLDSCPGHPSRLLQLNGAPQALTFCSNSGDLVLALGSRLCLVSHRLYLPTSYLVKVCSEHRVCGWGCCGQTSLLGQGSRLLSLLRSCARMSLMWWMTLHYR